MKHSFLYIFLFLLFSSGHIQAETIIHLPLSQKKELAKWNICSWKKSKGTQPEILKDADSRGFLRLGSAPKGLFLVLPQPVTLTPQIKKLKLSVEIRLAVPAQPIRAGVALTSRNAPTRRLQPFQAGADSGIQACGYQFNKNFAQHQANFIQVRRTGHCIKALSAEGNTGFLRPEKMWQKWCLEYDGVNKILLLQNGSANAVARLHHVDLTGETMRGLWLSGNLDFRNVCLDVEK